MVNVRPPRELPGAPARLTLPAGTPLFRLHSARRAATAFNPAPADCLYGGGRFDATRCDRYGYLYAGLTAESAVCESLLRSVPFDPAGTPRLVPRAAVRGRRLSFLRLAADLEVLSLLTGRDLASVGQDSWLVQAEAAEYPFTRHWGHWIREHCDPWAQAFVWPSKREPGDRVVVLFGDRCPADALVRADTPPVDLDTAEGTRWLDLLLEPYQARVAPAEDGR
ncbi:RES family NAD+ phosphorylase [Kitasatospora sp. NPDC088351]|uniref:RES family NAD+ phosphorylase n=1 Tax=unclassified Kitasatospora TaxID=2633591 RepID=UPI003421D63E